MDCELVVNAFQCLEQITWYFAGQVFLLSIMLILALGVCLAAWWVRK